ncbi:MAG TPA: alkaline phosphatase family protein [Candidatus Acidoferrum sp.]|jgi:predicted AlkP superfamily pyrophosphatase or phosphodiesterase|nr:alkaline phosphatase family protein [Candidatus Acidoferrum sp.]
MMKPKRIRGLLWGVISLFCFFATNLPAVAQEKGAPLLVVISVDGLRPDYVTAADAHGAKVPHLRKFLREGTYALGVTGVIPTVTYPSHTTLVTGVWPVRHGILANQTFDPLQKNHEGWYWYAEDIRVPTLWDAAAAAGRTTASIQWPVTVGAKINWNIPELWRAGTAEDAKLLRVVSTPGLLAEGKAAIGEYRGGIDATPESDEVRGKYAVWILENKHPGLLTVHLIALDHIEHEAQAFSPKAMAVLERLDAVIGKIWEAAERVAPGRAFVAVVSDHGFVNYGQQLNLFPAFEKAKLFSLDDKGKISDWRAMPWETGGSAAIVLKDPKNGLTAATVRALLAKLAADPANGIDRVLEGEELHSKGGYPNASFFVGLKPGWRTGTSLTGPVVTSVKAGGTHGGLPDLPDLRAAFFLVGPGVPAGKNLGLIDMRDIAPTLAKEAGLSLPTADGQALLP